MRRLDKAQRTPAARIAAVGNEMDEASQLKGMSPNSADVVYEDRIRDYCI